MKQAEPCGYSYGFSGCSTVSVSGSQCQLHCAPLTPYWWIQADVEPDGRIERAVLMQAEPGQLAIESLAVLGRGEVAVVDAPIGDRAADAMDQLPDAVFALRRAVLAVEILADHDVGGQLAPGRGNFAVGLLEQHLAVFALDGGRAQFPLDGVERIADVGGAEDRVDCQGSGLQPHSISLLISHLGGAFFRDRLISALAIAELLLQTSDRASLPVQ